jgi:LysR family cys regulon transcriptional activator
VGIIAQMAYEESVDSDLVALDASHLFEPSVTHIGFRKGTFLRRFMLDFVEAFAPHLDEETVSAAIACTTRKEREAMFAEFELPAK